MAMMLRFTEDADMVLFPFVGGRLAAPAQLYSRSVPSAGKRHFSVSGGPADGSAHQGSV